MHILKNRIFFEFQIDLYSQKNITIGRCNKSLYLIITLLSDVNFYCKVISFYKNSHQVLDICFKDLTYSLSTGLEVNTTNDLSIFTVITQLSTYKYSNIHHITTRSTYSFKNRCVAHFLFSNQFTIISNRTNLIRN